MTTRAGKRWAGVLTSMLAAGTTAAPSMAEGPQVPSGKKAALRITSSAFQSMGSIPKKYTCEGGETSPPLEWDGAPAGTKSFVLIEDDPDAPDPAAPKRVWVHWVVYAIPAGTARLPEGASSSGMSHGVKVGKNDFGKTTYGGPCPPIGKHRYFHRLYALDTTLELSGTPARTDVDAAMKGHVLAEATLVGTYQKGQ